MILATNLSSAVKVLTILTTLVGSFAAAALPALAADGDCVNSKALIDVPELKRLLDEKAAIKIVDIRSAGDYEAGHIPGAIQIARTDFEDPNGRVEALMSTPEQMNRLLSAKGIANGDALVVYSGQKSPQMATRFWWVMDVYGHKNVRVLNGNYEGWAAEGLPVEQGRPEPLPQTEYKAGPVDVAQIVEAQEVKDRGADVVLLDVRSLEEYTGEKVSSGAGRGGRIPGAVHVFFRDALDAKGSFKPVSELKALYESVGATPDKEIIIYCMRAHRASHTMFVLKELLGYPHLKLYDGSWIEWSNVPELPIETGKD